MRSYGKTAISDGCTREVKSVHTANTVIMTALKKVGLMVRRPMLPLYTWSTQMAAEAPTKNRASWIAIENIKTML